MKMKHQVRALLLLPVWMLMCCLFTLNAQAQSVLVTLQLTDKPLEQVLVAIEKQTTYLFVYDKSVDVSQRVTIDVKDAQLKSALNTLFKSTNISYAVENTSIVLSHRSAPTIQSVTGVVTDVNGSPIVGAAVVVM